MIPGVIDEHGRRRAIDGAARRRIYLFRHGSVSYFDSDGNVVPDTDLVDLNDAGRAQAVAMARLFANVGIDRAMHSGLPRTRQTAELVLADRDIVAESSLKFREIQQLNSDFSGEYDIISDVAFTHCRAGSEEARFLGGERYHAFYDRIAAALEALVRDENWHNLALFAHGGTNAAILGWTTGLGPAAFSVFDQATCCLNVIDIDVDTRGRVVRKTLRATNITADDPAKHDRHCSDMETMARWMASLAGS